jgi:hypothetical protein
MTLSDEISAYIDRIYVLCQVLSLVNPGDLEETTLAAYASIIMDQAEQLRAKVENINENFVLKLKEGKDSSKHLTDMSC